MAITNTIHFIVLCSLKGLSLFVEEIDSNAESVELDGSKGFASIICQ